MSNELEQLGLQPDATVTEIKSRWKELASEHHPDRGGNIELFVQYSKAFAKAYAKATAPKQCVNCKGTGKEIIRGRGSFSSLKMRCKACNGKGKIY